MNKPTYLTRLQQIFSKKREYTPKEEVPWIKMASVGVSRKIRNDYVDMDYIDQLNHEERRFLKKFNEEFYNANFQSKGPRLHNVKERELDCYNRNNSRNRDIYALLKCRGRMWNFGLDMKDTKFCEYEEELIDYIDHKNFIVWPK